MEVDLRANFINLEIVDYMQAILEEPCIVRRVIKIFAVLILIIAFPLTKGCAVGGERGESR